MRPLAGARPFIAVTCIISILFSMTGGAFAQDATETPAEAGDSSATVIPPEELESLVAPIALYPDELLAQVLVASTYPLEIMQLQQWMEKNPDLEGDALAEAVAEQPWDPAIQSMAAVPDALNRFADDIQWTTELGNAFLAQQEDVMDAVQRMRGKAKDKGALESNEYQTVETEVIEEKTVIIVESSDPEVIYVPSYDPTYVYPPPVYPYPPIYYPPYYAGAAFVAFSVGFVWGAARWGGACCRCGWGRGGINININNNFNRINNIHGGNRNWQHNPSHRGGAPYADRATANKFGGTARGDSPTARQQGGRGQTASAGNMGRSGGGSGGRSGQPSASTLGGGFGSSSGGSGNRSNQASTSNRSSSSSQIGSRDIPSSSPSRSTSSLGGGPSGYSGSSARSYSSRGASSYGSMGARGGGFRGGGGRRR